MASLSTVITERLGRLMLIGLNRPQQRNRIDRRTADQLTHVIEHEFEADPAILGGVLYGRGEDFCLGLDCEELVTTGLTELGKNESDKSGSGPMGPTRMMLSKPLIAAISGRAIGGGLELALACDLRVAEADCTLGLHPRKYCIPMMDMGAQRLPALIGLSRALDLILTGRCLNGAEGLQFGLINRLVKPGTAVGIAVDLVNKMSTLPGQAALLADRSAAIRAATSNGWWTRSAEEYRVAVQALSSDGLAALKRLADDDKSES